MRRLLRINRTLEVVARCWDAAEQTLRGDVRRNHPGAFEEVITELFYGLFADELRRATAARTISQAFLRDVETEIPKLAGRGSVIAEGLVGLAPDGRTPQMW